MSDDTQSHGEDHPSGSAIHPADQDDLRHGEISRRHFIEHVGFMSGTALLYAACKPAEEKPPVREVVRGQGLVSSHRSLTNEQYDTMAAAVERIVPRDEEPGAIDLGVPEYIDRALGTPTLSHVRQDFLRGTEVLIRRATGRYKKSFPQLLPAEQDELLTQFKESPAGTGEQHYWTMLIGLTMEGLFGDPVHGGNRNGRGWELIGYGSGRRGCLDDHACQTRKG
jgi:gluconate 2-dehydrogenase gamma chain